MHREHSGSTPDCTFIFAEHSRSTPNVFAQCSLPSARSVKLLPPETGIGQDGRPLHPDRRAKKSSCALCRSRSASAALAIGWRGNFRDFFCFISGNFLIFGPGKFGSQPCDIGKGMISEDTAQSCSRITPPGVAPGAIPALPRGRAGSNRERAIRITLV